MMDSKFRTEWITAARSGDQDAIANLYNCAYQDVHIVIRSMIRADEDTVLDLLQDTFVKAFQRLDQLDKPEKYQAWVKQIARNTVLDHLRKSKAILFSELHDEDSIPIEIEDEDLSHLPDVVMDKQETVRLLHEILNSLPEVQRAVISMHYLQEIPIKEIAAILGRSENTVKVQLRNGRLNLEKKIRELEQKEDIKLYSLAPLPFLLLLLRNMEAMPVQPDAAVLGTILRSGTAAAKTAAAGTAAKTAGGVAVKKTVAGILAAVTLAGGAVVYSSVSKPPELPEKDLFSEDYRVTFVGENGEGAANVYCLNGYGLDYAVEPGYGLSNGDVVTLTLSAPNGDDLVDYCEEHYGFTPASDEMEYTVSTLVETESEPVEAAYDYETLVSEYSAIIRGEIPIHQAGIDLSQSALWVTPSGCTIDEAGFFKTMGTVRYSFVQIDLNGDQTDELISMEEYKIGNSDWYGTILDIFTMKDGYPSWMIAGAYRGNVDIYEEGIIRQLSHGGAHYYTYDFFTIQDGELVPVMTASEEDRVFSVDGEVCTENEFLAAVDQYAPILALDLERMIIIEP